ncbi:Fc.00g038800.m01.CDS01 [Cosmosporella sp. VM-42]
MSSDEIVRRYDYKGDAKRVYDVVKAGGVAICPATIGYGIITSDPRKLEEIFLTKQRAATKRHAMVGSYPVHRALHAMDRLGREIVDHLVLDLDLPLAVIAPFNKDHPMFKKLDDVTMDAASVNGTIAILVNAGPFQDELTKLSLADNQPILGSSANISQTGTKYRREDIQPELNEIADIALDYGLLKYNMYRRSSTMIDFSGPKPEIVRIGACYEIIKDALWRHFKIETPEDPGLEANPFGHLKTQKPLESLEKLIAAPKIKV